MKKLLTIAALLIGALHAYAWDFKVTENVEVGELAVSFDLYYAYNEDGKTVSVVRGPGSYDNPLIVIPEKVTYGGKTYTVTIISANAFEESGVESVVMANTIEEIQTRAFHKSRVKVVSFSKGLKHIRDEAFGEAQQLERVELFDGLLTIGDNAFDAWNGYYNSAALKVIILPSTLQEIGSKAFAHQEGFTSIVIPDGVKEIKGETFRECRSLTNVTLPKNLEYIDGDAFLWSNVCEIVLPNTVKSLADRALTECNNLQKVVFSSGMTEIPNDVLSGCQKLSQVTIPNGITKIGGSAFNGCSLLSSISVPESVTEIGGYAFASTGIQTFKFPSKITAIPDGLFDGCASMTTFTIPNTITSIGSNAFSHCQSLRSVTIPNTVTSIGSRAFYDSALEEINIPSSVTTIGSGAFYNTKLKEVTIPTSVTSIDWQVFAYCGSLEKVNLPAGITGISADAFKDTGITKLWLSSSLEEIYQTALSGCSELTELHIARAIPPTVYYTDYWSNRHDDGVMSPSDAILYVPTGAKATYEATGQWSGFKEIREEAVDGTVTYQVKADILTGSGTVTINGSEGLAKAVYGTNATVRVIPSGGYEIDHVLCNGEDVTDQLKNGQLTISNITANYALDVFFRESPVTLTIRMGDGGTVGAKVARHQPFSCAITPESGWKLNSVVFNGNDVTADVIDGVYTTPQLDGDAELSVAFEMPVKLSPARLQSGLKAYVSGDGQLHISGTARGEQVTVVAADGKTLTSFTATDVPTTLPLPTRGVYIVHSQAKDVKVCF